MTEDMYNKSCHVFYFDYKTEEYKLAEPYECYEKLYRYDDDLEQFVEIDLAAIKKYVEKKEEGKVDKLYKEALAATKKYAEKKEEKMDNVNHPKHYEGSCSIECIDAMRFALGDEGLAFFCAGNTFKYLWRYKFKNGKEDLDKAGWYRDRLLDLRYANPVEDETIKELNDKVSKLYLTVTSKEENAAFEDEEDEDDE